MRRLGRRAQRRLPRLYEEGAERAAPIFFKAVLRAVTSAFCDFAEAFGSPSRIALLVLFCVTGAYARGQGARRHLRANMRQRRRARARTTTTPTARTTRAATCRW